ncbi:MAG: LON peptidase substrate-binding domain-containing protein [Proteobacteria bacterium]|jgi:uncharacterized protein|nr:LON peptidase substrate-binding domain-containing protein [Pseudomonadota bacterium]
MTEIALFPLPVVVLPGGRLPLRIFETRYLDMVRRCLGAGEGFGIVLIDEGEQTLANAEQQLPSINHQGTYSRIIDFDQYSDGTLAIVIEGEKKFAVRDQYERADRLMMAEVTFLAPEPDAELPEGQAHLAALLESLIAHQNVARLNYQLNLGSAREVGSRLAELLPCSSAMKQRMLEMKDPMVRLDAIERVIASLEQHGPS